MGMHSKQENKTEASAYLSSKYLQCWQVCPCFIMEQKRLHPCGDWARLAGQESNANLRTMAYRTQSDDVLPAANAALLLLWSVERGDFKHRLGPEAAGLICSLKCHEKINAHALKTFTVPSEYFFFSFGFIVVLHDCVFATLFNCHSSRTESFRSFLPNICRTDHLKCTSVKKLFGAVIYLH